MYSKLLCVHAVFIHIQCVCTCKRYPLNLFMGLGLLSLRRLGWRRGNSRVLYVGSVSEWGNFNLITECYLCHILAKVFKCQHNISECSTIKDNHL